MFGRNRFHSRVDIAPWCRILGADRLLQAVPPSEEVVEVAEEEAVAAEEDELRALPEAAIEAAVARLEAEQQPHADVHILATVAPHLMAVSIVIFSLTPLTMS